MIEVVWTRSAVDKLEVWRKLGAQEVWIWESDRVRFHVLRDARYELCDRSELLPDLDPELIAECMQAESQTEAVRMLRSRLNAPTRG